MTTLNLAIGATGNDGKGDSSGGFSTSAVGIGNIFGTTDHAFFRYTNVTIAAGSTIDAALLTWTASATDNGTTFASLVQAEDADSPAAPTTKADLYGRVHTTASVAYAGNGGTGWTANSTYSPADIKAVVQEVIDRAGWASGNAVQILWDDNGSDNFAFRGPTDYGTDSAKATKLDIDYTAGAPPSNLRRYSLPTTGVG